MSNNIFELQTSYNDTDFAATIYIPEPFWFDLKAIRHGVMENK